ncbi:MAG: hypothetical protein R3263_06645 [Myxococcota bacterium]|nr:hypothetical protein [Myxococcota bacterium]
MARRMALPGAAHAILAAGVVMLFQACSTLPPRDADDLCAIFAERPAWREATRRSFSRWGVPEPIQVAFLHQESRFRHRARPGWRKLLGVIPVGRLSSAYGFGQVKDGTWDDYRRHTGNEDASRDDFADVVDFVGWYGDLIHRTTGVAKHDAFHLYLAYHEGPTGFERAAWMEKDWLRGVARKVAARADLYEAQYATCGGPAAAPPAGTATAGG